MYYLTLKEIIENIYRTQDLGTPQNLDSVVDNFLNKPDEKRRRGVLYPIKEDELDTVEHSSIRNAGAIKPHSHFPKKAFKRIVEEISKCGNTWIKEYVRYLMTKIDYPIIKMNDKLKEYIDGVVEDDSIIIPNDLRSYLKNPYIAYDYNDDKYRDWIRLAWLIIFSVLQSDLIKELSSLWILPDEYVLTRCFTENYNISVFSSSTYTREIIKVQLTDDDIINLYINFLPHEDVKETPEWASLVMWLPNGPLDYRTYSGKLCFDIRAVRGISEISLELQNADNSGGHKYYLPFTIENEWRTICKEFSKKAIPSHILKSFGAICFVIHPDSFLTNNMEGHLQIKNIFIK